MSSSKERVGTSGPTASSPDLAPGLGTESDLAPDSDLAPNSNLAPDPGPGIGVGGSGSQEPLARANGSDKNDESNKSNKNDESNKNNKNGENDENDENNKNGDNDENGERKNGTGMANTVGPGSGEARPASVVDNSAIFQKTFETIVDTKEAKRNEGLRRSVQNALDSLHNGTADPHVLFATLKTVCEVGSTDLKTRAIDLFAKLFDYGQFSNTDEMDLTGNAVDVIAACFDGEGTDPEVELQVLRALMHSILLMPCHGASLLKAVRLIYNVFIFSLNPRNQSVAQGILTQVIGAVFQRVVDTGLIRIGTSSTDDFGTSANFGTSTNFGTSADVGTDNVATSERLTLSNLETLQDETKDSLQVNVTDTKEDVAVKDAFLIFRAMCKLSVKDIETETLDMRSHSMRSKLLSLHIIHTILKQYIDIFLSQHVMLVSSADNEKTRLVNAIKQYLCLSLSRNAASPIAPVFELSLEIFWLVISNLRAEFKREIPVFWDEIYFPVSEMKTSTPHQKRYLLSIIERLLNDSRIIIEFYLNYDCDSNMPNICERAINYLTRLSLVPVEVTAQQKLAFRENRRQGVSVYDISRISNLVSSTMVSRPPEPDVYSHFPLEYALKMTALSCIVAFLRSLCTWAQKGINDGPSLTPNRANLTPNRANFTPNRANLTPNRSATGLSETLSNDKASSNVDSESDAEQFETLKQRKKALLEGIRQFNQRAKKGVAYFVDHGFIPSHDPKDIALFLLETDGLDKTELGEYLGDGSDTNVAIMHAFADLMDFTNTSFVDALRTYLQAFRLPGEAQKIDRFMLKFAERYILGNPGVLATAESAYVLSYSVIMLNTDLHSAQIKNKMPLEQFIRNNEGIDDNKDIPRQYLEDIYHEISTNEIKLQSEQHTALLNGNGGSQGVSLFGGRNLNREAYFHASKEMLTKTEKLVRDLGRATDINGSVFYSATSIYHVKSIFDTLWMSILAGLTAPFKEYTDEDIAQTCLDGIKLSIKIACMFDLKDANASFIGAVVQFQNLNNYSEMSVQSIGAIHIMLEIAISEGDHFDTNTWTAILTSISQLERLQLIANGVDKESIPDVSIAKLVNKSLTESQRNSSSFFRLSSTTASQNAANKYHNQRLNPEVAARLTSSGLATAIDKVFVNSATLNGDSIVDFIRALSKLALEEIASSGHSNHPRLFSLQKIVDICYYNMTRIRVEWSHIWSAMGETFNIVGCHDNINVTVFAIDSLRQLSMRFFEIDELSHFKFQREFLRPFEYIIVNNDSLEIKDMVLECVNNMILAKLDKIKSGWKTIFAVLVRGARENKESLVYRSFRISDNIVKKHLEQIKAQEAFADLVNCFTELCKNGRFQKINLLALDVLEKLTNQIAAQYVEDRHSEFWFPLLFGFHHIIMTGEELEVRAKALSYIFDILLEYGDNFDVEFWNLICTELLFPIFTTLNKRWEVSKIEDSDDNFSVWLSTTLIQALRSMIMLFDHYFANLRVRLKDYLDLLSSCICQENDTITRIGRSCLHSILLDNVAKFNDHEWELVVKAFTELFAVTEAQELFDLDPLGDTHSNTHDDGDVTEGDVGNNSMSTVNKNLDKNPDKSSIVIKCVLQLSMIESLNELFDNEEFYNTIPYNHLVDLAELLKQSFVFAKGFNDNYDLRVRLWNAGIIERLPNLLKQESSSAAVYINIIFRLYDDDSKPGPTKNQLIDQLVPLCDEILGRFALFDESNQQRNLSAWRPVIIVILHGLIKLDHDDFVKFNRIIYDSILRLFTKSLSAEMRNAIQGYLVKLRDVYFKPE